MHAHHVSCESQSRVRNDSKVFGLRQMSPVYCNKEGCGTSRFRGDDKELHLGYAKPSEDIHQAPRYLSLELWGGVWAQNVSVVGISRRMAFKAKRQGWVRAKWTLHVVIKEMSIGQLRSLREGKTKTKKEHIPEAK